MDDLARVYVGMNLGKIDENFGRYALRVDITDGPEIDIFPGTYRQLLQDIRNFAGGRSCKVLPYNDSENVKPMSDKRLAVIRCRIKQP